MIDVVHFEDKRLSSVTELILQHLLLKTSLQRRKVLILVRQEVVP